MFLSIILVQNTGFKELVEYVGVSLSIFAVLVVLGVVILRRESTEDSEKIYKAPFGNIVAIIFALINICMIYYVIKADINKLFYIFITIISGYLLYLVVREKN